MQIQSWNIFYQNAKCGEKMNGLLIYEKEDAIKNEWFINELIRIAKGYDILLRLIYLEDICFDSLNEIASINGEPVSFCINRSRNSDISCALSDLSIRQFNCTGIIEIANDKGKTYDFLSRNNIPCLEYVQFDLDTEDTISTKEKAITILQRKFGVSDISNLFPLVVKPSHGHGGNGVAKADDIDTLIDCILHMKEIWPHEESVIIQKCARTIGRDLRIYIIDGTILSCVMRSSASGELCANFSLGGKCELHALTKEEQRLSDEILRILDNNSMHPDFIGIDLIYDDGNPVFNEIEDAVGSRMLYQLTDLDVAELFISHIASVIAG